MNELVPTIRSGSESGVRVGKLVGDLAAFASLDASAEDGDRPSGGLKPVGDGVEVFDPGGQYQDVGSGFGGVSTSSTICSSRVRSATRAR
jgi:hypothetical protein